MAPIETHVDQPSRYAYRPALDGLRALAVVAVMLYHGPEASASPVVLVRGGFLGVDLFFVLSGYLITTLLVLEWRASGGIRLAAFYGRRLRRLLPALLLVLGSVAVLFLLRDVFLLGGAQSAHFRADELASLFYVANWQFAFSGQSYFDLYAGLSPLRHLWSLAIEEQFYFVWPLLLYSGMRWGRLTPRRFAPIAAAAAVGSALLMARLYQPGVDPSRVYYGTDTRAQALLVGAFLAFVLVDVRRETFGAARVQALGWAGLVGVAACFVFVTDMDGWMYRGGYLAAAACAALAIVPATGPQEHVYARALGQRPLVWIGMRSYGLYLWHWPVYIVLSSAFTGLGGVALLALRLAFTFGLAVVSYQWVEAPIRFGGWAVADRRRWLAAAAAALVLIVAALVVVNPPTDDIAAATDEELHSRIDNLPPVHPGDVKVSVVGDSVAQTLVFYKPRPFPGLAVHAATLQGCGIVRGKIVPQGRPSQYRPVCETWPEMWRRELEAFDPDLVLLVIGAWEVIDHESRTGEPLRVGTKAYEDDLFAALGEGLRIVEARHKQLVILTSPCFKVLQPGTRSDFAERNDVSRVDWLNGVLQTFAAQHPESTHLVDLHSFQCPTGQYQEQLQGVKLSEDGAHYTADSAPVIWRWLRPQLTALRPA